ncbi:MAG: prenyltransferase [Nitrosopumilaceae archaeon]
MQSVWLKAVRIRFLLASVIAVSLGLAIAWWQNQSVDIFHAVLTYAGVVVLHASVDLLNDYWDYKRGIDTQTKRTKLSGGSGVLPEGLLQPSTVYKAGVAFLIIGAAIGGYFVYVGGIVIAIILTFAVLSIYFYSTRIVDSGLGELFVAIKGTMIVLGTYFIQVSQVTTESVLGGIVVGTLSALVLFVTSFPDFDADKSKGRKTLVILLGKEKATKALWIFPAIAYGVIVAGVSLQIIPVFTLITLLTIPLLIKVGRGLRHSFDNVEKLVPVMTSCLSYSRITGALLVLAFVMPLFFIPF